MSNISELRMLRSHFPLAVLAVAALGCQQTSVRPGSTASAPAQENGSSQPEGVEGPFIEEGDTYEVPQEGPATDCPDAGACDQGAQTLDWWLWRAVDRHWGILEVSAADVVEESLPESLADGTVTIPWIRLTARFTIWNLLATGPTGLAPTADEWVYVGPKPGCYAPEFSESFPGTDADRASYVTPCSELPGGRDVFDAGRYLVLLTSEEFVWAFPLVDGAVPEEASLAGSSVSMDEIQSRVADFKSGNYTAP